MHNSVSNTCHKWGPSNLFHLSGLGDNTYLHVLPLPRRVLPTLVRIGWSCHTLPGMVCCPQHELSFCKHSFFNCPAISFSHSLPVSAATLLSFLSLPIQSIYVLAHFCLKDFLLLFPSFIST